MSSGRHLSVVRAAILRGGTLFLEESAVGDWQTPKIMDEPSVFACPPSCANEGGHYVYNNLLRLANFMREDDDNVVFRRFESLQLIRLLVLQHRLSDCEAGIKAFLQDHDVLELDKNILDLDVLLRDYDDALGVYERMQARQRTPQYAAKVLKEKSKINSVVPALQTELRCEAGWRDLMSIAPGADKGVIHRFIDYHNQWLPKFLRNKREADQAQDHDNADLEKSPRTASQPPHSSDRITFPNDHRVQWDFFYYSSSLVRCFENGLIGSIVCALVVLPLSTLTFIDNRVFKILIVLACVFLAFLASLLLSRQTQRSHLTIILAYAAMVVVFVGDSPRQAS